MVSALDLIDSTNQILALAVVFPFILNLKYYYQLKIRDYLYVSLYFLFYWASYQYVLYENLGASYIGSGQIAYSLYYVAMFFLITLASRSRWNTMPLPAKAIAYFYLGMSLVNQLPFFYEPLGNSHVGQYFFNPLNIVAAVIVVYLFFSSPILLEESRNAVVSKYLWVIYALLTGLQDVLFYFLIVLPDIDPALMSLFLAGVLQINFMITQIVLLTLHIFYPEAVLFSYEQVVQASKHYKSLELEGNFIQDLGIGRIKSYLESLPIEVKNEIEAIG